MPGIIKTELGSISIPDEIVATIAGYAASENYACMPRLQAISYGSWSAATISAAELR